MKIISINVGQPRTVEYEGKKVLSSIWKDPVAGPVRVGETNLAGDRQASLAVHGGIHKAVYAFSHDQYAWWQQELQRDAFGYGMFGENLTVDGLDEDHIRIGDQWQAGNARFAVTGPRIPCSNLAMRFGDNSVPRRFTEAARPGVYLRVLQTGAITAGDVVTPLDRGGGVSVRELFSAYTRPRGSASQSILSRTLENAWLDPELAACIDKRLEKQEEHLR